jgi:hypothetical protein
MHPLSTVFTRSFFGSCAFLLLPAAAARAQGAWRVHFAGGPALTRPRFAYRSAVPADLRVPVRFTTSSTVSLTRQLTEHLAVGVEERVTELNYALRYRYPNHGRATTELLAGFLYEFGLNGQWLVPLGLRWELGTVVNASFVLPAGLPSPAASAARVIWRATTSGAGQALTVGSTSLHRTNFHAGAELRLLYWLGGSSHGLQLTASHRQGLRPLLALDSREFSYLDAGGQRQTGAFGLRIDGSYSTVQLGYCYAMGQVGPTAAPRPRWRTPRYSEDPAPPAEEDPADE